MDALHSGSVDVANSHGDGVSHAEITNGHGNASNGISTTSGTIHGTTNGITNGTTNGYTNGYTNGATNGTTNGYTNGQHLESPSTNGHTANGVHTSGCPAYHDSHSSPKANGAGKEGMMPIAICGMACRLPGGLESPQDLWEFLLAKKNARGRVPESRYNISSFHSPTPKPGTISTEYGCFLDESVDLGALDTSFFSLPRTEVERADPQQRLMLEVSRECFEDAGVVNWRGKTIGCYIGNFGEDWVEMFAKEPQQWGMHRIVGTGDFVISNRLSYEFDLKGPSMTIRTGCSAALVCLNEACAAIQRGDCEAALVGGVNLILAPNMTIAMTEQGILSKDGACKSFSAEANGYARGEAATAIYVKPLADALRDGNPVRAVIRATSHNVDGKTPGLSQPSTDAQEALIRRAYQVAGIEDYGKTAMVECHGTGTPTGDPIEAKAVARVFGKEGVYIGSVKPNMGHTEGASGLVSLMKMVKSLEHRTIPPNIRFHTPNPNIPFKEAKLTVPVEPTSWPEGRYERISLNSFGVGGANAHVILESAATFNAALAEASGTPETPQLLLFTANSSASLGRLVENYKSWYEKHPDRAADLAYTLGRRREHLPYRAFAIAANGAIESTSTPSNVKGAQTPTAVMVFTGQGAQWPLMGRELLQSNAVFRSSIRALDVHLHGMAYSIEEELKKPPKKSRLSTAELAQPLCTAVQVALVDTLRSIGVVPDAVVGHSSGELAAAYAAGALTAAEAILAAHHRGAVTTLQKRKGAMAAIGMGWADTEKHLVDNTTIACDNSPKSVTISGDAGAVEAVVSDIKKTYPDVMARLLQVDKAYHSYHMAEIGEQYLSMIGSSIVGKDPVIPFFSSVTGALLTPERKLGAEYWRDNLQSPVRFNEAVSDILNHDVGKNAVFLEIGPHAALAGPLRQIFTQSSSPAPYVSAMTRNQNCATSFLAAVGKLHSLKVDIDLAALFPTGNCLPELPRYPWNHEDSYWYEPRVCKEWRHRAFPYHDLLGVKQPESTEIEPTWRNMFHLANVPWVRDHRVGEDIVFPFAGYIALVGEAVRQTADAGEGFSIRNMKVSMALVLNENKPTEMITSFRPHRLTDSLNSPWWDFTVSSYNGHVWTKHCTGEVSGLNSPLGPSRDTPALPRELNAKKYYKNMAAGGLDLGPCFQTLDAIRTSTQGSNQATSKVINGRNGDEPNYFIHPTVIDATIQIHGAAAVQGRMRQTKNWLPTSIGQISIQRCASDMVTTVTAKLSSNHSIIGGGWCTADGQTVLTVDGLRMSLADGALSSEIPDTHAAARHEWAPHIDFVDAGGLIRPSHGGGAEYLVLLEELGHLCLLSSKRSHAAAESETPHLQKYAAWLASEAPSTVKRLASALKSLDNEALSARIEQVLDALRETPAAAAATAIRQVRDGMGQLLSGQPLDSIVEDATLTGLYAFIDNYDTSQFLKTLRHSKPNLRVLEIGTGRGSAARDVIRGLTRDDGSILCSKYIFTSTGFISAKDHAQVFPNMDYATLDISQDPAEQGFADTQFDLIIATNALHTTRCLQTSLAGVKKLLAPDGRLLLRELCPASKWLNYVLGALPGWWAGAGDGRTEEPYIGVERWQAELAAAGLGSIDAVVLDAEAPHQLTASLIARHSARENHKAPKAISVLCERESIAATEQILSQLRLKGYEVSRCTLDGDQPSNPEADVIALLDLEKPFFESLDEARFQALKDFLHRLGERGLLWVTRNSHLGCRDPRYAQVVGLARVIRSELVAEFATCEVDEFDSDGQAAALVAEVFNKFQARKAVGGGSEQSLEPDYEWAVSSGRIQIGRFFPFALRDKLLLTQPGEKAELQVATPGRVNSLHWVRAPREDLKAGEVEVQVHSAGLNFRDILVALGVVELPIRQFGLEAAGIVTRVGEGVDPSELAVGDRVFCLKKQAYSTYITTPTVFCTRIPDDLGFDEAASMLMPYVTALHGLVNVGRIAKGQRALIHSACGGVGLAAVQVCQMVGAELYCTVGSEEKAQFLEDVYQVPRHRIFNSRDQSFVGDVMRETSGEGMDIILNSLSGELLHATWACVAEFGTLVEIGKRDLIGGAKLDMNPFLANRSYCCIDIDQLWKKPVLLRKLILDTLRYYVEGKTTPVRPTTIFPASQTQDAFRFMQKGQHIGRVGISIPHNGAGLSPGEDTIAFPATPRLRPIAFDRNGSYLLVGGLGGLGRAISVWMAEHGAGELTYLSRSAGLQAQDEAFVAELRSLGCEVQMVRGDVNVRGDVERAVAAATRPLRGILQMSMVLRDQNFDSMTFAEWTAATAPKVQGTWNLHEATERAGARLDFMVLFSSLSGVIGQPGQANYASGNTFLDAFAQYRNSRGLAASVVDIGAVEGVGFISENHGLMSKMKTTGFKSIAEQELLDAMVVAMLAHPGGAATVVSPGGADPCFADPNSFVLGLGSSVPLTSPSNRAVWRKDRRMAAYHNAAQGDAAAAAGGASNAALKMFLAEALADAGLLRKPEAAQLLAREIGLKLFDLLLKPAEELNTSLALVDLGLDSLVALELRAWWKQVFAFDITVLEMLGMGSLDALGQHAAEGLLQVVAEGQEANGA